MNKQLNEDQIKALAPYESHFATAIRAGFASYPGEQAISKMRDIWTELTGSVYPMNASCSWCLMNLMRDLGQLYFAAVGKDPDNLVKKRTVVINRPAPAISAPAEATETPKPTKAPAAKKKASNAKK